MTSSRSLFSVFLSSLLRYLFRSLPIFLNWITYFLIIFFSIIYILWIIVLYHKYLLQIFFLSLQLTLLFSWNTWYFYEGREAINEENIIFSTNGWKKINIYKQKEPQFKPHLCIKINSKWIRSKLKNVKCFKNRRKSCYLAEAKKSL